MKKLKQHFDIVLHILYNYVVLVTSASYQIGLMFSLMKSLGAELLSGAFR